MKCFLRMAMLVAVALFSAQAARASVVYTPTGIRVTGLYMYSEFGGGDVAFTVSTPPVGCDGLWLRPTDPGFKQLYAMVMTAYVTQQPLQVGGIDDSIWNGSASRFCRVYGLYPS